MMIMQMFAGDMPCFDNSVSSPFCAYLPCNNDTVADENNDDDDKCCLSLPCFNRNNDEKEESSEENTSDENNGEGDRGMIKNVLPILANLFDAVDTDHFYED